MNDNAALKSLRTFFEVVAKPRTWGNVAYIWLAFPLGLGYFIFLVTGSALSIGLSLLWIGLLLAVALLLSVRGLEAFERFLSKWLLNEPVATRPAGAEAKTKWEWFKGIVTDASTWKGALFLFLKFPIGLACWVVSVIAFAVPIAFVLAPFETYRGEVDLGYWIIQDPTGGWLMSLAGVLMLVVTLHLHNAMGLLWKFMTRHLLGSSAPALS